MIRALIEALITAKSDGLLLQDVHRAGRAEADDVGEADLGVWDLAVAGLRLNPRQEGNIAHMHRVIDRYLHSGGD